MSNIQSELKASQAASNQLRLAKTELVNNVLLELAKQLVEQQESILTENTKDLERMDKSNPKYDRLALNAERIGQMAQDLRQVAQLPSPVNRTLSSKTLPNGLEIKKKSVAFGVIGIIYEARPNVTIDVFSLCLKSGNACVLKGGSDALYSNKALVAIIHQAMDKYQLDKSICQLLPTDREATAQLLNARGLVDLIIPRGSQALINYVREHASIPVIETGAGICHTYVDEFADPNKAMQIINNAKTRRPSVCNSLDCVVIHESMLKHLPLICSLLPEHKVTVYADEKSYQALSEHYPSELLLKADKESYGTEFLDYKLSIKTVGSIQEAMEHISVYSSKHSEAIITENSENESLFCQLIDAAAVYCNASTAFTDGAQFGLGAEIGISTQKLHARGPMALEELCSYKWVVTGSGQIRN